MMCARVNCKQHARAKFRREEFSQASLNIYVRREPTKLRAPRVARFGLGRAQAPRRSFRRFVQLRGDPRRRIFSAAPAVEQFVGKFVKAQKKFRVKRSHRAETLRTRRVATREQRGSG